MSVIVEYTMAGEDFLLGEVLRSVPDVVVEIERVVAHADERVTPYFWISGADEGAFDAAVLEDPSVGDVVAVDEYGGVTLYRAEWRDEACEIVDAFRTIDVALLEAAGQRGTWRLRLRFDDREAFDAFNAYRRAHDVSATIERIYHPDEPNAGGQFGLTPTQQDTLLTALEAGYYDLPRRVTHDELAERLGVSQQSISNRLHRAHGNLVRSALTVGDPDLETQPMG
jgi:predicted DNA binding protein